ncbi:hypothetical protein EI171_11925 [Bradyrhizobium sp. LCT2]|uniref:hypothetical protein n=1 Tax=Bradyrhizobium sp. LCT2 TaxID=2493093 RepID=UPI0013738AF3|nr:hypothetical protein [Bradyrhizobium sp. LCT2]QHP67959.1 hypothetical protein EI171_11925 [Bradyrhizobium sp. LCT2]
MLNVISALLISCRAALDRQSFISRCNVRPPTPPELTGRMRFYPGEKIDRGQVRNRREPFLDDGNVRVAH